MSRTCPRWLNLWVLLAVVVAGGCSTAPRVWVEPPPLSAAAREAHNLKVYDHAVRQVEKKFFDADLRGIDWPAARSRYRDAARRAPNDDDLYAAINALLAELGESHTGALAPRDAFQERNRVRVATGFMMRRIDERWVIMHVYPGSAAEAAGVRPGWLVQSRDGEGIGLEPPRFSMVPGQEVRFEFLDHEGGVRAMTLQAGPVQWTARRESRVLDDGTLYVRFEKFDTGTIRWLSNELEKNRDAPAAIIDVRDNPGGLLVSVRFAIAQFFPRRIDVGTFVQRSGRERETGSLTWGSARFAAPVVVLVNEGSASSSEIFAHVLQHHERATIVGRKTAGAVIAAREYRLPDGGLLQVAISDYLNLDGRRLEGNGVIPDVVVDVSVEDLQRGRDTILDAALAVLRNGQPVPTT